MLGVLDLFSGIGGFSLGLESTGGYRTAAFCEFNSYCQQVLRRHWPEVPIYGDIKTLTGEKLEHDGVQVDVVTGGFPCQPFSSAGKRKGTADDRHLWPEMLRVIAQTRPTWVIGENVAGFVDMELDQALADLEDKGYAVRPFVIPACAVDAQHRRDRVWIVANATGEHVQGLRQHQKAVGRPHTAEQRPQGLPLLASGSHFESSSGNGAAPVWNAEPSVGRMADGIPHRVDRCSALGNAVVPQVVAMIGDAILEFEAQRAAYEG